MFVSTYKILRLKGKQIKSADSIASICFQGIAKHLHPNIRNKAHTKQIV